MPRRSLLLVVVAVVAIVAIAGGVFAYVFYSGAYSVQITSLNATSPADACGYGAGLTVHYPNHLSGYVGNVATISIGIRNLNTSSCTIHSARTNTSSFAISDVHSVTIPGLGSGTLTFTLTFPSSKFTGPVWILFS